MLLRVISVISLIQFILLMISGMKTETALYRSLLLFLILFALIYLFVFFLNIIRENPGKSAPSSDTPNPSSSSEKSNA